MWAEGLEKCLDKKKYKNSVPLWYVSGYNLENITEKEIPSFTIVLENNKYL